MASLRRLLVALAILVPVAAINLTATALAEKRVALVVGNSAYKKIGRAHV